MSIFDNRAPTLMDFAQDGHQLKADHKLVTAYIEQTKGVGLESLDQSPAHKLIEQGLMERYGKQISAGTEGLGTLMLAGAVIAGGYSVYKKLMRAKNNPVLKNTAEAEANVDKTYTTAWLEGKEPVDKPVKVSYLSTFIPGDDFSKAPGACNKAADDLVKSITGVVSKAEAAWKKIEPIAREWCKAKDDEERKAAHAKLKAAYAEAPYLVLSKEIVFPVRVKSADHPFTPLSKEDYPKAVALLKHVVSCFDKVDEQGERVWMNLGLWDEFDSMDGTTFGADDFFDYAYAENIHDYFGRDLFSARNILLDLSRGLEEWIVKSFK